MRQYPALLLLILIASMYLNALQWAKGQRIQSTIARAVLLEPLETGGTVRAVDGRDGSGRVVPIIPESGERGRIIYWASLMCRWCDLNEPLFKALVEGTRGRFDVVVVVADANQIQGMSGRLKGLKVVAGVPEQDLQVLLRFNGTPTTLVVDSHRTVLRMWRGAYATETKREVEAFFGLQLPDLRPPSGGPSSSGVIPAPRF